MSKKKIISAILVIICSFLTACASGEIMENVIDNREAALGDKILVAYYSPNGQVQENVGDDSGLHGRRTM